MNYRSKAKLATCHTDLITAAKTADSVRPIVVLEGERSDARQAELLARGASRVRRSRHQSRPSEAVDIAPSPYDPSMPWDRDRKEEWLKLSPEMIHAIHNYAEWCHTAGLMQGAAAQLGVQTRWLGDEDGDGDFDNERWRDLAHHEFRGKPR